VKLVLRDVKFVPVYHSVLDVQMIISFKMDCANLANLNVISARELLPTASLVN
jgi:hypothetical protein